MACESNVIAEGAHGCVTVCGCGVVTVNCGKASMRIARSQYMLFARMIDESFTNLAAMELNDVPAKQSLQ